MNNMLQEVESVFPFAEMPSQCEIVPESPRYIESAEIQEDMEEFRGKELDARAIRTVHRYLPILSPKAIRWILPHYLRFCLTSEAKKYSRMEITSLITMLNPYPEFEKRTILCLSLVNNEQIMCLIHFLEWCLDDEYLVEFFSDEIRSAIKFLQKIGKLKGVT